MERLQLRGPRENADHFPQFENVVFSSSVWKRQGMASRCVSHATLTHLTPGDSWPSSGQRNINVIPVELSHVYTMAESRQQGMAGATVRDCLAYAARRHWNVVLRVSPYGRGIGMSSGELAKWYGRLGFTEFHLLNHTVHMVKRHEPA